MAEVLTLQQKVTYTEVVDVIWSGSIGNNYIDRINLKTADIVDLALKDLLKATSKLVYADYTFRRFKLFYDTAGFKSFRDNVSEVDRQHGGRTLVIDKTTNIKLISKR